jgi:hypothetical protein
MKESRKRNRKNLKIQNLAGLTKLSIDFSKKLIIFEKRFGPLRKFE